MKKLIPALCMLLVAASILGTSTYAWFSMNDKVTAEGMTVTATSDSIFLEIKGEAQNSVFDVKASAGMNKQLKPVAHNAFDSNGIEDLSKWYYKFSTDPTLSNANGKVTAANTISSTADFSDHVATTTYQVQLHANGGGTAYDLYVSGISIVGADKGVTVIIAGDDGYQEFTTSSEGTIALGSEDQILFDEVTTTAVTVKVYIFFDGNHEKVYTNNASELIGEISFNLKAFADNQLPVETEET